MREKTYPGGKYQIQIKRKAIRRGYWWEVDGYSLTPFKVHLWALLVFNRHSMECTYDRLVYH